MFAELADLTDAPIPVGIAFPTIVKNGLTLSAGNISHEWIGLDGRALLSTALGRHVDLVNDAGGTESELSNRYDGGAPIGRIFFVDANGAALTPTPGCASSTSRTTASLPSATTCAPHNVGCAIIWRPWAARWWIWAWLRTPWRRPWRHSVRLPKKPT